MKLLNFIQSDILGDVVIKDRLVYLVQNKTSIIPSCIHTAFYKWNVYYHDKLTNLTNFGLNFENEVKNPNLETALQVCHTFYFYTTSSISKFVSVCSNELATPTSPLKI